MSFLHSCGVCCMLLSIWAVIQLILMGLFFKLEVICFIEEAEADEYEDYDDFIKKTKENFSLIAINCWIAAVIYFVFIFISWFCIMRAKKNDRLAAEKLSNDIIICQEKNKVLTDALATKIN